MLWYRIRWGIEEWHRVLKTGCNAEGREFETAEHLQRVLAFDLIAAWRLLACLKIGRALPQLPARLIYTEEELLILWALQKKLQPPPDLTLEQANRLVACLGGYTGRKNDGPPGAESLGTGMRKLILIVLGWVLHRQYCEIHDEVPTCV